MKHSLQVLLTGIGLLIGALVADLIGSSYQLLVFVLLAAIMAVGGAVVAVRGMFEFLGERLQ